jgi:large subunit ribosomal protein L15
MKLDQILSAAGAHKKRTRYGRGTGSGKGKTSGRGTKGAGARSGSRQRLGYEGGSNPQIARLPKRGFSNANFRKDYQVVNVSDLQRFEAGARVDAAALKAANLIGDASDLVKVLGGGELDRKLTVVANAFSASASEKIAKAGGAAERI